MTSPADRALEAQVNRLERSNKRQQRDQQQAQATAFYRGNGEYSTLGAEGSYRPRGTVTSGGVPIGQAVPANNGLVGGMPAGSSSSDTDQAAERLAQVAQERGPQIGDGDPNTNGNTPRYPQDHYYDSATGNLWQWQGATEEAAGLWILIAGVIEQIDIPIDAPENRAYLLCQSQRYPLEIIEIFPPPDFLYTATLTPAPGQIVEIGGTLTLTISGVPDDAEPTPVTFSIETRRI